MARNSSGTYTAPTGQPVVSGTVVASATQNTLVQDIGTEITDSLSRSGKGGMTAPLRTADGSVSAPAHSYTSETGTGLYRAGASDQRMSISGTDRAKWTASGFFADVLTALTAVSATVKGAIADGASAVGVIIDNTIALATTGAKLVSFRSNGSEKAAVDKDGNVLAPKYRPLAASAATVQGTVADGASAVGVVLDNTIDLTNAGAKLASFQRAGVEKAYVDKDGKVFGPTQLATLASPTFTGTVTVPTPSAATDAATKGYVDAPTASTSAVSNVHANISNAPGVAKAGLRAWFTSAANNVSLGGTIAGCSASGSTAGAGVLFQLPTGYRTPATATAAAIISILWSDASAANALTWGALICNNTTGDVYFFDGAGGALGTGDIIYVINGATWTATT